MKEKINTNNITDMQIKDYIDQLFDLYNKGRLNNFGIQSLKKIIIDLKKIGKAALFSQYKERFSKEIDNNKSIN